MPLIPIFFGCALFATIYSLTSLLPDCSAKESDGYKQKFLRHGPSILLISAALSLLFFNASLFPLSLLFLSCATLLRQKRNRSQFVRKLNREMPFLALSLSLLIEAGCSIQSAIDKLHARYPRSPAKIFLHDVKNLCDMGVDTGKGMREISSTYRSERADLLLEILMTGKALGSGPGKALKQISDKMISDRVIDAEERALKAPVLLMIPLCLFIFPAIFLLIFSPIIIQMENFFR